MTKSEKKSSEARALERVADAAREVQTASIALEAHFSDGASYAPTTLELARFAAAMQELKDAREAFDELMIERETKGAE
ncbi:hypothetical protein AWB81_07470 [Caballeronia arationis]|uniref:hypothetical protein n=1 Tax=Caballeronia arationis TaxID=1777142 RepID=UPI00074C6641|nr:hypothetical protein [Caballeronia arationis]SAL06164.1 hypothetical protein AWB81_07470 [Caballeronia arationis]